MLILGKSRFPQVQSVLSLIEMVEKFAIEIESGQSRYLQNLRQNLAARYDKIIIIATSKSAHKKIEKQLAQTGLLIPEKVELILRNELISPF